MQQTLITAHNSTSPVPFCGLLWHDAHRFRPDCVSQLFLQKPPFPFIFFCAPLFRCHVWAQLNFLSEIRKCAALVDFLFFRNRDNSTRKMDPYNFCNYEGNMGLFFSFRRCHGDLCEMDRVIEYLVQVAFSSQFKSSLATHDMAFNFFSSFLTRKKKMRYAKNSRSSRLFSGHWSLRFFYHLKKCNVATCKIICLYTQSPAWICVEIAVCMFHNAWVKRSVFDNAPLSGASRWHASSCITAIFPKSRNNFFLLF